MCPWLNEMTTPTKCGTPASSNNNLRPQVKTDKCSLVRIRNLKSILKIYNFIILGFYRPQTRVCGKVIFLHVCVILSTGGCIPSCNGPGQTWPPRQTPPWADTPPQADTPPEQTCPPGLSIPPGTKYTPQD